MARPRLMMVTTCLSHTGGAETQVVNMAVGLSRRGWDVEIVTMLPLSSAAAGFPRRTVRVTSLEMERGMGAHPGGLPALSERGPRAPAGCGPQPHGACQPADAHGAAVLPMPVLICTLHGHKMYSVRAGGAAMRELAHRLTDGLADVTTAVSAAAGERYARVKAVSRKRLMVIPNGVPDEAYTPNQAVRMRERRNLNLRDEFAWLAVGRLEEVKDYATMLRAFAIASGGECPQVLLIAECGSLRRRLEALAEELGIASARPLSGSCDHGPSAHAGGGCLRAVLGFRRHAAGHARGRSYRGCQWRRPAWAATPKCFPTSSAGLLARATPARARRWRCGGWLPERRRRAAPWEKAAREFVLSRFGMESNSGPVGRLYSRLLAEKGITETVEVSG
jgi:glycosyltransferase involved in cell wall biosynthesis